MIDLREALDRTLLLMRDELVTETPDAALVDALTATEIALVADEHTLGSLSAQTAFTTIAMLCARSGHRVYLLAPDIPLAGLQPPLVGNHLVRALLDADNRIVPTRRFETRLPVNEIYLELRLGASPSRCAAVMQRKLMADSWSASLLRDAPSSVWNDTLVWPLGAMAGAALAAAEAFKCGMRKLKRFARNEDLFEEFFRPTNVSRITLAAPGSPMPDELGAFDVVSGGAITNGLLYALTRIPSVRGLARVIEPDITDPTNLNRYMLLLTDRLGGAKVNQLSELDLGGLSVDPCLYRFEGEHMLGALSNRVLVGVDHIPTRWSVQRAMPAWVGVGATTHWSAMASFHTPGSPCAGCLHPRDDATSGPIPTVAFVSFMAALFLTTYFLLSLNGRPATAEHVYLTLPRPETLWRSRVAHHPDCPLGHFTEGAV